MDWNHPLDFFYEVYKKKFAKTRKIPCQEREEIKNFSPTEAGEKFMYRERSLRLPGTLLALVCSFGGTGARLAGLPADALVVVHLAAAFTFFFHRDECFLL